MPLPQNSSIGCSLVFFACSSIVVSRSSLPPHTPSKCSRKLVPHSRPRCIKWGVTAACVIARLLNRSGCVLVIVFENSTGSAVWLLPKAFGTPKPHFDPLSYLRFMVSQECSPDLALFSRADYNRFIGITHLDSIFLRSSKTPPSPCAYCIGRPRSPSADGSLFVLPPSLNSRSARAFQSFHSAIAPFLSFHLPHTHQAIP